MLFSAKKIYLGVDIGSSGIKIVELKEEKGKPRLNTYGFIDRPLEESARSFLDTPKETAALIARICKAAKTSAEKAVTGISAAEIFSSVINVPAVTGKDLTEAITLQAKKLITAPLEEMVLDWKIIGANPPVSPSLGKMQSILLTAVSKSLVQKYVDIFKLANLELVSLEPGIFGLIRSLVGKDKSLEVIVDIGALKTGIFLVEAGAPFMSRSLNIGGNHVTKGLAELMGVVLTEAEEMKKDAVSFSAVFGAVSLPKPVEALLIPLVNEIKYILDLYFNQNQSGAKSPEKIIITGGGAPLPHLTESLSAALNVKVYIGDPWARVLYPDELRPTLESLGPRFAQAVGLAMREME